MIVDENFPLNISEKDIVKQAGELYDKFCKLPVQHPMDKTDFANAVHVIQRLIAARAVRKLYPDDYYNMQNEQKTGENS